MTYRRAPLALTAGDLNVGAAFASAYRGLPAGATLDQLAAAATHPLLRAFASGRQA